MAQKCEIVQVVNREGASSMEVGADQQRWGMGTRQEDVGEGRSRILVAAIRCYEAQGVAATTVDDVAREAQISRRTVYRYFASQQAIVRAVVEYQAGVFLEELQEFTRNHRGNFRSLLVDSMLFAIERGPQTVNYKLLLQGSNAQNAAQYYLSDSVTSRWVEILSAHFAEAQSAGEFSPSLQLSDLVEWMGRLVLSWIQFPAPLPTIRRQAEMLLPLQSI